MLLRAARAAAVAALVSWGVLVLLCLAGWGAATSSSASATAPVAVASLAWSMAHLAPLSDGTTTLSLVPLGLVAWPLTTVALSLRSLRADLDGDTSPRIDALGGIRRLSATALAVFVATYTAVALAVALLGRLLPVYAVWWQALLGGLAVAVVGCLVGLRRVLGRPAFAPLWRDQALGLLPVPVRRGIAVGLRGAAALLLAGLVPAVLTFVVHLGQVAQIQRELQPGLVGGALLALGQAMLLPNVAAWGLSWLAGPGFGVGLDSSFTWTHSSSVLLPNIPVLGALPDSGTHSALWSGALLVPVAVGLWTARTALGTVSRLSSSATKAQAVAVAVTTTLVGALAALALSGGALGTRALADVGPRVLLTTLALLAELGAGASLALAWSLLRFNRR